MPWFDRALEIDPPTCAVLIERAATLGISAAPAEMLADTRRILSVSLEQPVRLLSAGDARRRAAATMRLARSLYRRTGGAFDNRPAAMLLAGTIELGTGNAAAGDRPAEAAAQAAARQPQGAPPARLRAMAERRRQGRDRHPAAARRPRRCRRLYAEPDRQGLCRELGDEASATRYLGRAAEPRPSRHGTARRSARRRPARGHTPRRRRLARARGAPGRPDPGAARPGPGPRSAAAGAAAPGRHSRRSRRPCAGRRRTRDPGRLCRRRRRLSPGREPRLQRAGGAPADRGPAQFRRRRRGRARC